MTETEGTPPRTSRNRRILLIAVTAFLVLTVGGIAVWTTTCPCNRMPGFMLLGEVQETPVTNWSFVNDVPLCQIQVYSAFIPHSVNLNCMATPEGELFLSCSVCSSKFWASQVGDNEPGRLRLNGRVYPVVLNRVLDEAVLDRAWAARVKKLQVHGEPPYNPAPPPDAKRPPSWWSFQLRSAVD